MRIYTVLGTIRNFIHGTGDTLFLGYALTPNAALAIKKKWLSESNVTSVCGRSCRIVFGELAGVNYPRLKSWACKVTYKASSIRNNRTQ